MTCTSVDVDDVDVESNVLVGTGSSGFMNVIPMLSFVFSVFCCVWVLLVLLWVLRGSGQQVSG